VQQNIPAQQVTADDGNASNEENNRREELTNFEISTRVTETIREGFTVQNLSIAILVNRERLESDPAKEGAVPLETQLFEIEQLASAAAGYDKERGDKLKIAAVPFANGGHALEPIPPLDWKELLLRQAGTLVNALTILLVAALLIWFGLRPAMRSILARPETEDIEAAMLTGPAGDLALAEALAAPDGAINLIEDLTSRLNRSPQKRLEQIVEYDEVQAAAILRQWLHQEARA
jgi:flagellar M-ring protein FliF